MGNMTKPPANILDLPLGERAEMALKAAVEKVVEAQYETGGRSLSGAMVRWLRYPPRSCETRLSSHSDFLTNEIYAIVSAPGGPGF
jgi:hypothetical protein